MLTQDQAVGTVQLHIEGVLAGSSHFVGCHTVVHGIGIFLAGAFIVNQGDRARPKASVGTGQHFHTGAFHNGALLQFSDGTFDPVRTGLLDGDVGHGIAIVIGTAFRDRLDTAGNRRYDYGIFQHSFCLGHAVALGLDVDLRLLQIQLNGLDLDGIFQTLALLGVFPLFFQFRNLVLIVFNGCFHLLQLQALLIQAQLQLLGIIRKQLSALSNIVAFPDKQFLHHHLGILLNLDGVLRNHNAGETVTGGNAAHVHKVGHLLHKDSILIASAGQHHQTQAQSQTNHKAFFHKQFLRLFFRVFMILFPSRKINRILFKFFLTMLFLKKKSTCRFAQVD